MNNNHFNENCFKYEILPDSNECYHCNCDARNICGSNIRFFGVDCAGESQTNKDNKDVIKDRTKKNSNGSDDVYWLHLRPNNCGCDGELWFITFRIYFKFISAKQIEIGWIGRHLYQPCRKKNKIYKCERPKCPLNPDSPDYDKNDDDLTNFLKQWP